MIICFLAQFILSEVYEVQIKRNLPRRDKANRRIYYGCKRYVITVAIDLSATFTSLHAVNSVQPTCRQGRDDGCSKL